MLFSHVVNKPEDDIDLGTAALVVGEFEYPDIDVANYLAKLDALTERAQALVGDDERHSKLQGLNRALFQEAGYRGNEEDYNDPRNSFINEVIDRKIGTPISLSVIYIEVGRRMGIDLVGVNFPGHFLVRYQGGDQSFILDPFHLGMTLPASELRSRVRDVLGADAELLPEHQEPATKRQILARMLTNLSVIYRRAGDFYRHIEVIERLLILEPENNKLQVELKRLRRCAQGLN